MMRILLGEPINWSRMVRSGRNYKQILQFMVGERRLFENFQHGLGAYGVCHKVQDKFAELTRLKARNGIIAAIVGIRSNKARPRVNHKGRLSNFNLRRPGYICQTLIDLTVWTVQYSLYRTCDHSLSALALATPEDRQGIHTSLPTVDQSIHHILQTLVQLRLMDT